MRAVTRVTLASLAAATLAAGTMAGAAQAAPARHGHGHGGPGTVVYRLDPSTHGNPEGVAWDRRTQSFYVGATGDGTIYRGTLWRHRVRPFITVDPSAGRAAVGMTVAGHRLYVAGGPTGTLFVYNLRTRALVGSFATGPGGFLNDLVVTPRGDVYVTDSFRPTLWHVTRAQVRAGHGTPTGIDLAPEITYQPGQFNLNGIVSYAGGRVLVTVDSFTGTLYRIVLTRTAPGGRLIAPIQAPPLVGGDGMLKNLGRLVVVIGSPASLKVLRVDVRHLRATLQRVRTDPTLNGPSTVARARNRLLVVNADFATSTTPFTVSGLRQWGWSWRW